MVVISIVLCLWLRTSENMNKNKTTRGLFSWSSEQLVGTGRDDLFDLMDEMDLDTVYQSVPLDAEETVVSDFLEEAAQRNVSVWLLTGHPEWGLDAEGTKMIEQIQRAAEYQKQLEHGSGFLGVMMDCEPYLTELWDEKPVQVMDSWCSAMERASREAERAGLYFSACIPYYIDTFGFSEHLERLLENGCDMLAIMNYYRENEGAHIETEVELAAKAGIPVTVIYEMQPPGKHGLEEINTYYKEGIRAVEKSWDLLCEQYGEKVLSIAFHEYNALREVLEHE